MTTIKDIAKIAGVSYSTVSKALHNNPVVKEETRKRIWEIAEAHNYRRNFLASQLVSGRSQLVGLVLDNVGNPVFADLTTYIHEALLENQYHMVLALSRQSVDLMANLRVDGLIYWGNLTQDSDLAQQFISLKRPILVLGNDEPTDLPSLKINRKGGILTAIKYLKGLGHRHIGLIGNSQEIKVQAFRESLREAKLSYRQAVVLASRTTWEDGYRAVKEMDLDDKMPTAWIGVNNLVTQGALRAFLERGFKIPRDISLVGYDELPEMERAEIPLTTVGPPLRSVAETATHLILALIEGRAVSHETWIEPVLQIRQSTGPVSMAASEGPAKWA
ncbi:MAG: LacI family DNA-binding transcriptional regulator [Firmicutes bacterium]|nr:LacI family DNA-binding transcriptional regulator [Bacillota bacterium]